MSTETTYFDLHTTGIGYLNRIREVKPSKGSAFWSVTVAALKGRSDQVEYAYIDCNIVGAEAEKLVKRCKAAADADKKVLVSFRIGDIRAEAFEYKAGPKKGQAGVSQKGRLLYIGWIKIDGVEVYNAKPTDGDDSAAEAPNLDAPAPKAEAASSEAMPAAPSPTPQSSDNGEAEEDIPFGQEAA